MDSTASNSASAGPAPGNLGPAPAVDTQVGELTTLLKSLDESAAATGQSSSGTSREDTQLAQARLGMAGSLFMALGCKHAATASHSMRVAMGCSAWAQALGLSSSQQDHMEVASLLHDVGKIGVPDHILRKPGKLTSTEAGLMARHHRMGQQIIQCCCSDSEILEIVAFASAWYDGSRDGFDRAGTDIPIGARMMAIVDAFDAMTTDQVYRPAISRERAVGELFACAGTQFDPKLVEHFCNLQRANKLDLRSDVSQNWLESLAPDLVNGQWKFHAPESTSGEQSDVDMFHQRMLEHVHDGMIFVDSQRQVFHWNRGAERITGITASAVKERTFMPSLLLLRDERGRKVSDEECPVAHAIETGVQTLRRLSLVGRDDNDISIDVHVIPVTLRDGTSQGAAIVLRDVSSETTLEERCQSLYDRATRDPMTQVANRAEFDRVHHLFIQTHVASKIPCSLIICDIDRFKLINDTYGHQAGDEVIKSFAALLSSMCRHGDLVARYGGEEFVVLCADCNNSTAAARADEIRIALSGTEHSLLEGRAITASFGVTENQNGDTPETMLRRADRALLMAKDGGRNRTVQLGTGLDEPVEVRKRRWWPFGGAKVQEMLETDLETKVPLKVAIEKLRGFVADHEAQIVSVDEGDIVLTIGGDQSLLVRRSSDRSLPFEIRLSFVESLTENTNDRNQLVASTKHTKIHVVLVPKHKATRRTKTSERGGELLASLRSYLMAQQAGGSQAPVVHKAYRALGPWRKGDS